MHFLFSSILLAIISLVCNTLGLEKKANFNLPETISWEGNNFKIHNFQCRWQLWGDSGYQGYLMVQWSRRMEASCNLQVFVWDWCRIFPIRRANMCHEIRELDLWWLPGRFSWQFLKTSYFCHLCNLVTFLWTLFCFGLLHVWFGLIFDFLLVFLLINTFYTSHNFLHKVSNQLSNTGLLLSISRFLLKSKINRTIFKTIR